MIKNLLNIITNLDPSNVEGNLHDYASALVYTGFQFVEEYIASRPTCFDEIDTMVEDFITMVDELEDQIDQDTLGMVNLDIILQGEARKLLYQTHCPLRTSFYNALLNEWRRR